MLLCAITGLVITSLLENKKALRCKLCRYRYKSREGSFSASGPQTLSGQRQKRRG